MTGVAVVAGDEALVPVFGWTFFGVFGSADVSAAASAETGCWLIFGALVAAVG